MAAAKPKAMQEVIKKVDEIFEGGTGYDVWSKDYDADLGVSDYNGPRVTANSLDAALGDRKEARILDVCAGTGLVAEELKRLGYSNMDAVDANAEMLELARKKNLYANIYCEFISGEPTPGIGENSYDALVTVGSLYPGALLFDSVGEFLRVVKKGGIIVVGMNVKFPSPRTPEELRDLLGEYERDGKIVVKERKEVEQYLFCEPGVIYVIEKLM